jgi:hypothetical protein
MKYIYGFILSFLCVNGYAQTSPVRTQLNNVFSNIDKSQVPTGFLQEYGEPLVPIDVFNGALTDSNKVDISAWYVTYATLSSSRIYGTNPLPDVGNVTSAIANDASANTGSFVVPMLFADYNYLRPDAITANLLSASNNQLYDVAGRAQSPCYAQKLYC